MKNHKAKILTAVFSLFALVIVSLIALSPSALADGEYDEAYLLKKALMNDVYTCYNNGHVRASIDLSNFSSLGDIAVDNSDGQVKLPNGFTNITDNDLSCRQLFEGYPSGSDGTGDNTFAGVTAYSNGFQRILASSSASEKVNALTSLGYAADNNSALSSQCMYITYAVSQTDQNGIYQGSGSFRTNQACAYVDNNGNVTSNDNGETIFINDSGSTTLDGNVTPTYFSTDGNMIMLNQPYWQDMYETIYCGEGSSFSSCVSEVNNRKAGSFNIISGQNWQTALSDAAVSTNTQSAAPTVYSMPTAKPDVAVDSLFGDHAQRYMSVPEVASLYQIYLNKYADVQCTTDSTTAQSLTGAGYSGPFKAIKDGAYVEGCYAKISSGNGTFNGYISSTWGTAVSLQNIIDYLNSNNVATGLASSVVSINAGDASGEIVDPNNAGSEGGSDCWSSSSALGWILCPIVEATANAVNGLYEKIVEPFLQLDVSAFDFGGGVYQAWQTFQSIANVIFVILFLVTIFSQLTGFGIDNLGIKRILPKLIIAAILVNLSYIICQALVDASNIVGWGAFRFFDNIQVSQSASVSTTQSAVTSFATLAVGGGAAAAGVATAWLWGPALVLPIVLTLITLLISIIFMFVLLGARQAGVIILVIASPIAFVLYMLPNTKPVFDKWKKFFQALLLLYPIAGLLMGGAKFAGEVIKNTSDDFWPSAIASLLSVVVFFFIPTLLRSSMSAVGSIGARISGLGQSLSRGAQGAARSGLQQTGAFKNMQERSQLRLQEREKRRLENVVGRIKRTPESVRTDAQKKQLAFAQSRLNRMTQEDAETEVGVKELDYEQAVTAARSKQFNAEVDAIGTQLVNEGIAGKTGDMKPDTFYAKNALGEPENAFDEGSLARYVFDAETDAQRYAGVKALMASGHHGETAIHQVMQRLAQDGKLAELSSVARAVKTDRNFGGLKGAARSTYDFVNSVENGDFALNANGEVSLKSSGLAASPDSFVSNVKFDNMSEEGLVSTNREELERYLNALESGNLSSEKVARLKTLAQSALSNERLASRRKGAVEEILKDIVNKQPHPNVPAHPLNAAPDETFNVNDPRNFSGPGYNSGDSGL